MVETAAYEGNGTKRLSDSDYTYDESKLKQSKLDINARLLVVGRYCGLIVGKKGETLGRLRKEYNVKLDMPASQKDDRIFSVTGDVESCVAVVKEVMTKCRHAPYPVGQKSEYEINLLVPSDNVGMVIGKGGDKLKEIRDQSNGRVKVYQECLPHSNERVVAIGGDSEDDVTGALKMILEILQDARRSPFIPYDPNNKPSEIMGAGMTGSGMQQNMNPYAPMANSQMGNMQMGGVQMVPEQYQQQDSNDVFQNLPTSTSITVPDKLCGAIIGKGGVRINEIRRTAGAVIDFAESENGRILTLTGTQYQVSVAEKLIGECIRTRTVPM